MAWRMLARELLPRALGAAPLPRLSALSPGLRQVAAASRPQWQQHSIARVGLTRIAAQSMSTVSADGLKEVLQNELNYEKSEYQTPTGLQSNLPKQWQLEEEAGSGIVTLTKTLGDTKAVLVINVDEQEEEEDFQDEEEDDDAELDESVATQSLMYTVSFIKGDVSLVMDIKSDFDGLVQILHVNHEKASQDADSEDLYQGPVFEDLDGGLQEEFVKYVESWGFTPDFNKFLLELSRDKEQREYMAWLERVHKFFS